MNNLINKSLKKLKMHNIPNPDLDLRILLNFSSNTNKEIILSNLIESEINWDKFNKSLDRRLNFEPISKIINKKNFWKYNFYVDKNVLDPRPESELIIEEVLKIIKNRKINISILDIGTGSGCLAICLAKEYKNSKIIAIDTSSKAMKIASKNIKFYKCKNQVFQRKSKVESISQKFDLIVSNPPYLSKKEYSDTDQSIKKYEPKMAFLGGKDGLLFYKKFSKILPSLMKPNSYLILEIGEKQALNCIEIFNNSGLFFVKKVKDLQKKDRILIFYKI